MTKTPRSYIPDIPLCAALTLLLSLGIVVLYSSSSVYAARLFKDSEHVLKMQLLWMGIGLVLLFALARFPTEWIRRQALTAYVVSTSLCLLVLVPGLGRLVGGARRWLGYSGIGFQPSEFTKLALVVLLAALLARREVRMRMVPNARKERTMLGPVLLAQIPIALVLAEPDLGTAVVMELLVFVLVFVAGLRWRVMGLLALCTLPIFLYLIVETPFRLKRMLSFLDPWSYRSTTGYQITEALIAIGSGGMTGTGLGESKQKLFFLPEAHTDFVFAILSEELGFIGACTLVLGYGVIIWRGARLALKTEAPFARYLALGCTAMIAIPAIFNLGVVTGLLPTKGLPLPFISYGGTHMLGSLIVVGILLGIDREHSQCEF
jgi:cell division protein FtsW